MEGSPFNRSIPGGDVAHVSDPTEGSSFSDIVLTAYRDTGGGLAGLNAFTCVSYVGSLTFGVEGGVTYYIQAGYISNSGELHVNLQEVPPPANDNFANATVITSPLPFDETVDTAGATAEAGEPLSSCAGYGGPYKSIWYSYTPGTSGVISANVPNAVFAPVLAVYTGDTMDALTELGCQVFSGNPVNIPVEAGQVGMAPTSGQTYVCVSGQWRRNDLPACTPSAPSGTCDQMSMCLHRPTMILYGCSATNVWTAITGGGSTPVPADGTYNYSQAFSSQTSVTLSHKLGTANVLVSCYDGSDIQISPDTIDIAAADPWDVTVTFETAQTGRCVVNGSGNGTTGGGGDPGETGYTDLREDGAARVNDAEYIDFLSGFDVTSLGAVSLDYAEKPVNLGSSEVTGSLAIARGGTGNTAFTSNTCIRYDGTRLVSAATDCGSGGPGGFCGDTDNDCSADNAENVTCSNCVSLVNEVTGILSQVYGGTGMTGQSANKALMSSFSGSGAWAP